MLFCSVLFRLFELKIVKKVGVIKPVKAGRFIEFQ